MKFISILTVFSSFAVAFVYSANFPGKVSNCEFNQKFSEQNQNYFPVEGDARFGSPMNGMKCDGAYCCWNYVHDCTDLNAHDEQTDENFSVQPASGAECRWGPTAHTRTAPTNGSLDDDPPQGDCNDDEYMAGFKCGGRNCNAYTLLCCKSPQVAMGTNCEWSPDWFSETRFLRQYICPDTKIATSMMCKEDYCSNHKIRCCDFSINRLQYVGNPRAAWGMVCTGPATAICTHSVTETVSGTHDGSNVWETSMKASFGAGFDFHADTFGPDSTWGTAVSTAFSAAESQSVKCSNAVSIDPKCLTNTTFNLVVWQFRSTTAFDDSTNSVVATCFNAVTSSANKVPQCLPGMCADCDCQTCKEAAVADFDNELKLMIPADRDKILFNLQ